MALLSLARVVDMEFKSLFQVSGLGIDGKDLRASDISTSSLALGSTTIERLADAGSA